MMALESAAGDRSARYAKEGARRVGARGGRRRMAAVNFSQEAPVALLAVEGMTL